MRTRYLYASALVLVALTGSACSGRTTGGEGTGSTLSQKTEAANDIAQGTSAGDPCDANEWYGDGTCDSFCPGKDTDCIPDGGSVVCTMLSEVSDGECGRDANDPCMFQDPDCGGGSPGDPGTVDPDEPVACAMILEEGDGKCSRPDGDPCRDQDPDCDWACVTMDETADGVCYPRPVTRCGGQDPDCGVVCPDIYEMPDGVCEDRPYDPCGQDPDCTVTCTANIVPPDGVCPGDPCDPDCHPPSPVYDCDTSGAFCEMIPPTCPAGQTSSVSNGCYGPCVPFELCLPVCGGSAPGAEAPMDIAPPSDGICRPTRCGGWDPDCDVACDAYIEVSDGVCGRPAGDACMFQDPDCGMSTPPGEPTEPPIACAAYIEVSDGVCKRDPNDPCIFQDPDCGMGNGSGGSAGSGG